MNKILISIALALMLVLVFAVPVMAQDPVDATTFDSPVEQPEQPVFDWPIELPETAAEGLQVFVVFITFLSSLVAMYVTTWVRKLPLLSNEDKSKIVGLAADAVAALSALIIGGLAAYGAYVAGFLDGNGFWKVVMYVIPLLWGMHKAKKVAYGVSN